MSDQMPPRLIPVDKKLYKAALLKLLGTLEKVSEPAMTFYLPEGTKSTDVANILEVMPGAERVPAEAVAEAIKSPNGALFLWGKSYKYSIYPPFPLAEKFTVYGYQVEQYRQMLNRELTIAVIIVRLGNYALGLFRGGELITSKVGTGLVHARHKKGGSSQRRFERHREKQIEYFFDRICLRAVEKLSAYVSDIDYVFYGGEKNTIRELVRSCKLLSTFEGRAGNKLLNIRKAGQKTLITAIEEVWSSRVVEWKDLQVNDE